MRFFVALALAGTLSCNPFAIPEPNLYAQPQDPEWLAHQQEQAGIVETYDKLDEGQYRVPVNVALKRVAQDPALLEPVFEQKTVDLESMTVVERGEYHFVNTFVCASCHSLEGQRKVGPPLNNRWGGEAPLEGGEVVAFNDAYFRESVLYSTKKVARGYPPAMPVFANTMSESQYEEIKAYIETYQ
ncbi:MAG: c-type cytochrome [Myxococcota bacterium]